jgi:hypothetical protein
LHQLATTDHLWQPLVQANVPGTILSSPSPCASFRELYAAHDLRWFLSKHKLWFCDRDLTGKLVVARFDHRTGNIEAYQLLAISKRTTFQHWLIPSTDDEEGDDEVVIYSFEPELTLHVDRPVLRFEAIRHVNQGEQEAGGTTITRIPVHEGVASMSSATTSSPPDDAVGVSSSPTAYANGFRAEVPLMLDPGYRTTSPHATHSSFMLARALSQDAVNRRLRPEFPFGNVWPPPDVPADDRVAGVRVYSLDRSPLTSDDIPSKRSEMTDRAFRVRTWLEMTTAASWRRFAAMEASMSRSTMGDGNLQGILGLFSAMDQFGYMTDRHREADPSPLSSLGLHIGEEITTYATLDPALYTPTARYPYRGIWVGDYSGHGCEFLLIHQPERDDDDFDPDMLPRRENETDEDYAQRKVDETVYRGRLEGIKLTGDPNVPRGEYTFLVEDLGPGGFVRTIREAPFEGARVVKSKGHVAGTGFVNGKYHSHTVPPSLALGYRDLTCGDSQTSISTPS